MKGQQLKGALSRQPSSKLTRVSPGVYRNAQGQLTGPQGNRLPQQPRRPTPQNMGQNIGNAVPQRPSAQPMGQFNNPNMQQLPGQASPEQINQMINAVTGNNPSQLGSFMGNPAQNQIGSNIGQVSGPPNFNNWMQQQLPQPSQNQGGQYRLSPGVYGSREQAMQQFWQQRMQPQQFQQQEEIQNPYGRFVNY